jgi:hypothetical protein
MFDDDNQQMKMNDIIQCFDKEFSKLTPFQQLNEAKCFQLYIFACQYLDIMYTIFYENILKKFHSFGLLSNIKKVNVDIKHKKPKFKLFIYEQYGDKQVHIKTLICNSIRELNEYRKSKLFHYIVEKI